MSTPIIGRFPPPLKPGDLVRVISPAGPADPYLIDLGTDRLLGWGLRAEVAPHAAERVGFLAGEDTERLDDLVNALLDPAVAGVFCTRGGYGAVRLLDGLPWADIANTPPKAFVGFSDIGVVQASLWARGGWINFSGPQVAHGLGGDISDRTEKHLRAALEGRLVGPLCWPGGEPIHLAPIQPGPVKGAILPICLTMLVVLIGTPHMPNLEGSILVLEDTAEPPYRIDRMFWQLASSKLADQIAGIILGSFSFRGTDVSEDAAVSAQYYFGERGIPIWKDIPYGHQDERLTLPVGAAAAVTGDGIVVIEPGA